MKFLLLSVVSFMLCLPIDAALAGIHISPYVSVSSTKSIKPKGSGSDQEKVTQRQTYGVRAGVSFWRLFSLQLSVGQSKTTKTEKLTEVEDEFDEIDIKADANLSTDSPDNEVKTIETQRKARLSVLIDPSFWIFIFRARAGVQATQRLLTVEEVGKEPVQLTPEPTYKPIAGVGAGIRFTHKMKAMIEYNLYFYKFPEKEPFEREVSVSYVISI